jgi:folate-binding protein YgfZ
MQSVLLASYSAVRIAGEDRAAFLQGQLTQDVAAVSGARSALTGWTNAKGRLLIAAQLIDWQDAFWLPLPSDVASQAVARLRLFVLRSRVSVDLADVQVAGLMASLPDDSSLPACGDDAGDVASGARVCAARLIGDPDRVILLGDQQALAEEFAVTDACSRLESAWDLRNIRAGIPVIRSATLEAFVPQMVNLDLLDAISFAKGCYVGQEIVARTQNLGRIKRRMFRLQCDGAPDTGPGAALFSPDGKAGQIVDAAKSDDGTEMSAVIRLSEIGKRLYADDASRHELRLLDLPYPIPELQPA